LGEVDSLMEKIWQQLEVITFPLTATFKSKKTTWYYNMN